MPMENLWTVLCQNIKESLSTLYWSQEDLPSLPQEQSIWENWKIQLNQELISKGNSPSPSHLPTKWIPPPVNMIKLNFNGASKGNPGNSGFGGIFKDHQGAPLLSFFGSEGWDTNNSTELEGLWQGLIIAQHKGFFPLIIEGDSQIIINMVSKIMQGTPSHKVSKSWRMAKRIELIDIWLPRHRAIYIKHTR